MPYRKIIEEYTIKISISILQKKIIIINLNILKSILILGDFSHFFGTVNVSIDFSVPKL